MDIGHKRPGEATEASSGSGRGEWAYAMLHDAIREGTIEPGQRLMEVEVSDWLDMSRTPVREAMRRMQAEGMLEHAPGGGMSVVLYDLRAIGEFYATRESLEGAAAALAAQTADPAEIRIMVAALDAIRALPPDPRMHARENQAFHEHIYQAAHNRFLLKSLRSLLNLVPLLGRTTLPRARPHRGRADRALRDRGCHPRARPGARGGGNPAPRPPLARGARPGRLGGCARRIAAAVAAPAAARPGTRRPPQRGARPEAPATQDRTSRRLRTLLRRCCVHTRGRMIMLYRFPGLQ